jgi:hypothetical protein
MCMKYILLEMFTAIGFACGKHEIANLSLNADKGVGRDGREGLCITI